MNHQLIPVREAAEKFNIEDYDKFRKGMKKAGCVITISGADLIDMEKLQEKAIEKSQKNEKRKANRVKREINPIGLIQARIKNYPDWLARKQASIDKMKIEVASAKNPYEANQRQKRLKALQIDLERMEGNYKNDSKHLNAILNADYDNVHTAETTEAIEADKEVESTDSVVADVATVDDDFTEENDIEVEETAETVESTETVEEDETEEYDPVESFEIAESSNGTE